MSIGTDAVLKSMRMMAWERAKGELRSMLMTYWPQYGKGGEVLDNGFQSKVEKIEAFIKDIEQSTVE